MYVYIYTSYLYIVILFESRGNLIINFDGYIYIYIFIYD